MHVASPPSMAGRAKLCLLRMRIALAPVLGAVSGIAPHVLVGTDAIARAIESTGYRAERRLTPGTEQAEDAEAAMALSSLRSSTRHVRMPTRARWPGSLFV